MIIYFLVCIKVINRKLCYQMGSTFKIITLSAALEENLVDLDNETYTDNGSIKV